MLRLDERLLKDIRNTHLEKSVFKGRFGLEKENVRVDRMGQLALTDHPKIFGNKITNPYITTDFSESQVELITPPMATVDEAYDMLDNLHNLVAANIGEELLWPQSTPPILPKEDLIPLAQFDGSDEGRERQAYRETLARRYGRNKQLLSGIHYNFSLDDRFLEGLYQAQGGTGSFKTFRDNFYLKMMRHTIKYSWLLIKLLGSSPAIHESYSAYCQACDQGQSIRNGRCGYRNGQDMYVDLSSLTAYLQGINEIITRDHLVDAKEHYSLIRPKNKSGNHDGLEASGIEYLELRLIDLNPLYKLGISKDDLHLIHIFLLLMGLLEEEAYDQEVFQEAMQNNLDMSDSLMGARQISLGARPYKTSQVAFKIFDLMDMMTSLLNHGHYQPIIEGFREFIIDPDKLYAVRIHQGIRDKGFIAYHLDLAKSYLEETRGQAFRLAGYEDLELSTQILILDAYKRGIRVDILDRHENFIQLKLGDHIEWVKQATKTSKDTYSSVLAMENKAVTKQILDQAGIKTPRGRIYDKKTLAREDYGLYKDQAIVIKPNTTNFGLGITIFKEAFSQKDYLEALDLAFDHDQTILVEDFSPGKEYRLFVIGDRVVAGMHRVPANVIGDGKSSIRDLVEAKNQDPLRGTGYRKPLQVIHLGQEEAMFLSQTGRTFDTIPGPNQVVYLRENSNISTGGDSLDMTDEISDHFKEVAVKAAKAIGATISGVDLITPDIGAEEGDDYQVIELNFNPAIHIHCYPYKGENRQLGDKILDHLGF